MEVALGHPPWEQKNGPQNQVSFPPGTAASMSCAATSTLTVLMSFSQLGCKCPVDKTCVLYGNMSFDRGLTFGFMT